MDLENTLEPTVTDSFFDDTYDTNTTGGDDSITELKTRVSTEDNKSTAKHYSVNSTKVTKSYPGNLRLNALTHLQLRKWQNQFAAMCEWTGFIRHALA